MAETVVAGPHQLTLNPELLQLLTAGDISGLTELIRRDEEQTNCHVAITVVVPPAAPPATSCLLGVSSNGNTALHLAATRGHAGLAALICERAPSLAATRNSSFLDTPLHCAAKAGSRDVAACLLPKMRPPAGVDAEMALRARNQAGATALYEAVRHGHAEVVDLLMTEAPDLASLTTEDGSSPLYSAASIDSLRMVRSLLRPSQGGTPSPASFSGPGGRTALHVSATSTIKEVPQEILNWGAQGPTMLTNVDSSGRTPLQFAILNERLDVVQLFLDDVDTSSEQAHISDNHGLYPLHTAAKVGSTQILGELVKKCPDYCELVDDLGRNFLHCAVEHSQDSIVQYICQNDTFAMLLNATDCEGNTPLHLAAKFGFPRIVSLLLQTMAVKVDIVNKDGLTARDLTVHVSAPRWNYTLSPHCITYFCLGWSNAATTLHGVQPLYAGKKPTEDVEAPIEEGDMSQTGMIGSVLIATVAFAAAFTVPGGLVADDHPNAGTAVLARRFAFRAFVVSNTMAFVCSATATCLLIHGGTRDVTRNHRVWYNLLGSGLLPMAALFTIAAFAFGFQVVLGDANRGLVVFLYAVCLASVLLCFPGNWVPLQVGMEKAIWRQAGWRGLVNMHDRRPSLLGLFDLLSWRSYLLQYLGGPFFVVLICAAFVVAIALNIALPNY